jgi:nicotinate-nucleotide pyrophosphorylase (carboxylating)
LWILAALYTSPAQVVRKVNREALVSIVRAALEEDIGTGDVTSMSILPGASRLSGRMMSKEDGVVAGLGVASSVFHAVDREVTFTSLVDDGDRVGNGTSLAAVTGPGVSILSAERVALNFMQRMSGIATMTSRFVEAVAGTGAVILDTRKTVPGLRALDKLAVRLGGGQNHRFGLYDMVLIKDNHIAAAGSITEAVRRVRGVAEQRLPIEVEVATLAQFREALATEPDRIMLDNMSLGDMAEAVALAGGAVDLEASGNVTLDNVAQVAATGVDFISVGALTHSVRALDISLEITVA